MFCVRKICHESAVHLFDIWSYVPLRFKVARCGQIVQIVQSLLESVTSHQRSQELPRLRILLAVLCHAIANVNSSDRRARFSILFQRGKIEEIEAAHILHVLRERRRKLALLHPPGTERHHANAALCKQLRPRRVRMCPESTLLEDAILKEVCPCMHRFNEWRRGPGGFSVLRLIDQAGSELIREHQKYILILPPVRGALINRNITGAGQLLGSGDKIFVCLRYLEVQLLKDFLVVPDHEDL